MREREVFIVNSDSIEWGHFSLLSTKEHVEAGAPVPDVGKENIKFYSIDGSLADRLIAQAICKIETQGGKDVLLYVSKDMQVKF